MTKKQTLTARDIDILARTVYGESRGEGDLGMQCVAHVVMNRVRAKSWWGRTVADVCLYPYQFSAWLESDPNLPKLKKVDLNDPLFQRCYYAALTAALGMLPDRTYGSTHYHTTAISPKWSKNHEPVCIIGVHKFYNDIK